MQHEGSDGDHPLSDLFSERQWNALGAHLGLSERQREIARLICRGHGNEAIGKRLRVSTDTVRMHTRALYKKLKVPGRLGVVVRLVLAARYTARRHKE